VIREAKNLARNLAKRGNNLKFAASAIVKLDEKFPRPYNEPRDIINEKRAAI
jgi:hypothetical protein